MSYITLDTAFYANPKVRALGNTQLSRIARDMFVGALMYSRTHLTDGFIPLHVLPELDPITTRRDVEKAALALHSVGLFTRKRGRFIGYWIPDFEHYQQTKKEVEEAREQAKQRKRAERERKRAAALSRGDTQDGHGVTGTPVTPIEAEAEREVEKAFATADAGFTSKELDRLVEVDKILAYCRDVNEDSRGVLMFYARQVPLSGVVRIRENCRRQRSCGVGYAVNALKSEAKEAA